MLTIKTFVLGPVETNTYLVADSESGEVAVIDPAWDGQVIVAEAQKLDLRIGAIWLTHAHFDHLGGTAAVVEGVSPPPSVRLHPDDYELWRNQGGAPMFGYRIDPGPEPAIDLKHGKILRLGSYEFEVRHAPGHTRGHVIFYCAQEAVLFCGDVVFKSSIGRTDLYGGDHGTLMNSIHSQILTLPDEVRLYCGHGPGTTVGKERVNNPFLR